jgi:hypothetical protein
VAPAVALQGFNGLQIPPRCAITFRALAGNAFDASGIELDRDLVGLMDNQAATPGMADFMKLADNSGAVRTERTFYTHNSFSYAHDGSGPPGWQAAPSQGRRGIPAQPRRDRRR